MELQVPLEMVGEGVELQAFQEGAGEEVEHQACLEGVGEEVELQERQVVGAGEEGVGLHQEAAQAATECSSIG